MESPVPADPPPAAPPMALLGLVTVSLFAVWSLGIVVIDEFLVKPGNPEGILDWWELIVVRYSAVAVCTALYGFGVRGRDSLALLRRHPVRILVLASMMVPGYNVFLYFAQAEGLPPAIAVVEHGRCATLHDDPGARLSGRTNRGARK